MLIVCNDTYEAGADLGALLSLGVDATDQETNDTGKNSHSAEQVSNTCTDFSKSLATCGRGKNLNVVGEASSENDQEHSRNLKIELFILIRDNWNRRDCNLSVKLC